SPSVSSVPCVQPPVPCVQPPASTDPRHFAILTVANDAPDWRPESENSPPPAVQLRGVDVKLQAGFVMSLNGSEWAARKRRVAILLAAGGVVILNNVHPNDRPADPRDYPAGSENGMTKDEAAALAAEQNRERLKVARVPRHWSIAIRHVGREL